MRRARGGYSQGYTIIETLIFLAVSGAMFVSAAAFINGRQARAEFTTGARDFETVIRDIANDVSNGYFNLEGSTGRVNCEVRPASPNIITLTTGTSRSQGENRGCVFIGKAIQLAPQGSQFEQYSVISLAGRQFKGADATAGYSQNFADSLVEPISQVTETTNFPGRPTVSCAFYLTTPTEITGAPCSTTAPSAGLISFMTKFNGSNVSGGNQVDVLVSRTAFGLNQLTTASTNSAYAKLRSFSTATNAELNPAGGVYVCFQSGGASQYALMKIGGTGSQFSTNTTISSGNCNG